MQYTENILNNTLHKYLIQTWGSANAVQTSAFPTRTLYIRKNVGERQTSDVCFRSVLRISGSIRHCRSLSPSNRKIVVQASRHVSNITSNSVREVRTALNGLCHVIDYAFEMIYHCVFILICFPLKGWPIEKLFWRNCPSGRRWLVNIMYSTVFSPLSEQVRLPHFPSI